MNPWTRHEFGKLMDLYFRDASLFDVCGELERDAGEVKDKVKEFIQSDKLIDLLFQSTLRPSRKGKPLSQNERKLIQAHKDRGITPKATASLLLRDVEEIAPDIKGKKQVRDVKQIVPSCELFLAYRYAYYAYDKPLITDDTYDTLKAEETEFGTLGKLADPKDCPRYVKTLALYLMERSESK
jgi:hypothetical protein